MIKSLIPRIAHALGDDISGPMVHRSRKYIFLSILLLASVLEVTVFSKNSLPKAALPMQPSWTYHFEGIAGNGVSSDGKRVYLATSEARIEAIGSHNGEKLWATDLGGELASNLFAGAANVFVVTRSSATQNAGPVVQIRSLSKDTGITNWSSSMADTGPFYLGIVAGKLIAVSSRGRIVALNIADGRELWNTKVSDEILAEPAFSSGRFAVGTLGPKVLILEGPSGAVERSIDVPFAPPSFAFTEEDEFLWGDERGNLFAYDLDEDKTIWKLKSGARISKILGTGDFLLAASLDNFVYLVDPGSGRVRWKKRQDGQPIELATLPDGKTLAISDIAGESVTILSLSNGKAVDQLLPVSENEFVRLSAVAGDLLIVSSGEGIAAYRTGERPVNEKTARK